jgi:hypothetical protein
VKRFVIVALLPTLAVPAFAAGTHQDVFNVPCSVLWSAVNDTVKNSGKYGILGTDNTKMTASFTAGGGPGARTVTVVLHAQGDSCEMQTEVGAGPKHNDAGSFKDRVTASLAKLQNARASAPAQPEAAANPAAQGGSEKPVAGRALTNADVLKLKEAGLSDQIIIDKINASPAQFHLDTDDLLQLKQAGLSEEIIGAMIHASQRKE